MPSRQALNQNKAIHTLDLCEAEFWAKRARLCNPKHTNEIKVPGFRREERNVDGTASFSYLVSVTDVTHVNILVSQNRAGASPSACGEERLM